MIDYRHLVTLIVNKSSFLTVKNFSLGEKKNPLKYPGYLKAIAQL